MYTNNFDNQNALGSGPLPLSTLPLTRQRVNDDVKLVFSTFRKSRKKTQVLCKGVYWMGDGLARFQGVGFSGRLVENGLWLVTFVAHVGSFTAMLLDETIIVRFRQS